CSISWMAARALFARSWPARVSLMRRPSRSTICTPARCWATCNARLIAEWLNASCSPIWTTVRPLASPARTCSSVKVNCNVSLLRTCYGQTCHRVSRRPKARVRHNCGVATIKVLAGAIKHPTNRTQEEFHRYWQTLHGPMFAHTPEVRRYVQHHTLPEAYDGEPQPTLHGASMFWYDDLDALRTAQPSPKLA